jgi:hypothetical protein
MPDFKRNNSLLPFQTYASDENADELLVEYNNRDFTAYW